MNITPPLSSASSPTSQQLSDAIRRSSTCSGARSSGGKRKPRSHCSAVSCASGSSSAMVRRRRLSGRLSHVNRGCPPISRASALSCRCVSSARETPQPARHITTVIATSLRLVPVYPVRSLCILGIGATIIPIGTRDVNANRTPTRRAGRPRYAARFAHSSFVPPFCDNA